MRTRYAVVLTLLCLIASLRNPVRLDAQAATASLSGTVTDTSGAGIPGTSIEIRNTGTGASRAVLSDAQGRYSIPDLGIGTYDIRAGKAGFQTAVRSGLTLTVGSAPVVDMQLAVGQAQETVTVE